MSTLSERSEISPAKRKSVLAYMGVAGVVILLMMLAGLTMRLVQGEVIQLDMGVFYQIMTIHGTGMVGIAGLAGVAIMWYFLSQYVELSTKVFLLNLVLFLLGVVMILGSIIFGGFASAWTFLYPLPASSMGQWSPIAAAFFLGGLAVIGTSFLILHLDMARALISRYGSLTKALGWPQLFGKDDGNAPPATVVASTMVTIINPIGITAGAAILIMSLVNLFKPDFTVDALLAKNLIFFFGHVFINAVIYMAVIAVYEILSQRARRPWGVNKWFLGAWTASTIMVLIVYPHHLLMDFALPQWMAVMGQIISYLSGLPVLVVTAYGALTIVHRSGIRWDLPGALMLLATFGWAAGSIPAIIDGTIRANTVLHNTLWVPGHFHFYLLLGFGSMVFGFMYYLAKRGDIAGDSAIDRTAFWSFLVGGLGFVFMFLYSGVQSVPRRFAEHAAQWVGYDQIASIFIALIVLSVLIFVIRFLTRLSAPQAA
jgi:cytochrome c oxidase subunit 1